MTPPDHYCNFRIRRHSKSLSRGSSTYDEQGSSIIALDSSSADPSTECTRHPSRVPSLGAFRLDIGLGWDGGHPFFESVER